MGVAQCAKGEEMALGWARSVEAAAARFVLGEDPSAQFQAFEELSHCDALGFDCATPFAPGTPLRIQVAGMSLNTKSLGSRKQGEHFALRCPCTR